MPSYSDDDPTGVRLELEAVPAGSPSAVVARQLLQLLTSGDLAPGSRLPPERALAERLGVGRSAVREAIASLEILGVVQVRPGSGSYLRGGTSELLPRTLSWGLLLAASRTEELLEIRSGLEGQATGLAAERATEAQVRDLKKYLDRMQRNLDRPKAFIESDVRFHTAIAHAAGNEVLADLLQTIRSLLQVWTERGLSTRAQADDAYAEHAEVYEAIAAHDPQRAAERMAAHMVTASERVLSADHDHQE
ncbi:FadR/GntR family transcriptional regulator [Microlunatus soli]|uniref:Transcriptional regulator, GntR family n=1 Tax=Microlunatus soli TaxID=630515 RepID=A0A1H1MRJ2_9ACTN|nr:FadR/GntR family transcriptional regulator [Microlunatus soli]SDR89328.1 transcriptional regulator, GntR family [Microlunatus soli]